MIRNRVKFFFAGPILDAVNPHIPGGPHQRLVALVGEDPGVVLDLCAGTGYVARLIANASPRANVQALDISPEMLAVGSRSATREGLGGRVSFVRGDAAELPFGDASLDAVVVAFGFHELPPGVRKEAIAEIARTLRPGGRLLTVDLDRPARRSPIFDAYLRVFEAAHARDVLGDGLIRLLRGGGLVIVDSAPSQGGRLLPFQVIEARQG